MIKPYFLENFWVGGAFFIYVVNTGAIPYSLAVFPPYHVHVRQESALVHAADVAGWLVSLLRLYRRSSVPLALLVSRPPAGVHFPRRLLFCHPGVWASVEPSNMKPRRIHP